MPCNITWTNYQSNTLIIEYCFAWIKQDGIPPNNYNFLKILVYGFYPPYSPELNPVEMIWKHIRAKYFNNRIFETLDDVEKQLSKSLKEVFTSVHEIKQLTFYKWMHIN